MTEQRENAMWDVLVNNGYRYEYLKTIEAPTAKAARAKFSEHYAGDWRVEDFKVRKVVPHIGEGT